VIFDSSGDGTLIPIDVVVKQRFRVAGFVINKGRFVSQGVAPSVFNEYYVGAKIAEHAGSVRACMTVR